MGDPKPDDVGDAKPRDAGTLHVMRTAAGLAHHNAVRKRVLSAKITDKDPKTRQWDPATGLPFDTDDPWTIIRALIRVCKGYTLTSEPRLAEYDHSGFWNRNLTPVGAWPILQHIGDGAQCQAIVRWVRAMAMAIGLPGKVELVVVYALLEVDGGKTALVDSILPMDQDPAKYRMGWMGQWELKPGGTRVLEQTRSRPTSAAAFPTVGTRRPRRSFTSSVSSCGRAASSTSSDCRISSSRSSSTTTRGRNREACLVTHSTPLRRRRSERHNRPPPPALPPLLLREGGTHVDTGTQRRLLSWKRRNLMTDQPAFVACRAANVSDAAELMDGVMIVSRAWRPPPGAVYQYRIAPEARPVLQLRVVYATPGGPLEVRASGTAVVYALERVEPPTADELMRLSHAMFGEWRRLDDADAAQRRPFALQMFAPDVEGTRFIVLPPGAPPQRPIDWMSHTRDFFGGLVTGRRIELVSLAGEIDRFGQRLPGTPRSWEPSDLAPDLPGAEPQ